MPKITTKTFVIAGQSRQFGIWYTETDKFFVKDFDENVGGMHSAKFGAGNFPLEEDLYEKVAEAIKAYEEKIATSKKVIVIDLTGAKCHLKKYENEDRRHTSPNYIPSWLNAIYQHNDYTETMGFYIRFKIKMFRKVGNQHEFFDIQESGKLCNQESIPNLTCYQIIDWTQEKEDALTKLQTMFDSLLHKFVTAMKNPELFIEAINSQKLLN